MFVSIKEITVSNLCESFGYYSFYNEVFSTNCFLWTWIGYNSFDLSIANCFLSESLPLLSVMFVLTSNPIIIQAVGTSTEKLLLETLFLFFHPMISIMF